MRRRNHQSLRPDQHRLGRFLPAQHRPDLCRRGQFRHQKPHAFHGNVAINASTAKMRMVQVAEEIIAVLAADPNAEVKVAVEIQVNFPSGASDQTKRAVTENARTLNFRNADWE